MDSEKLCLLNREDFALVAAGFEPTEEGTLWRKAGVWFGREAAPQSARKELRTNNEDISGRTGVRHERYRRLLRNNERCAESFDKDDLPTPPKKGVAVVACMDARLNVYGILGLEEGDAHVIRTAGGVMPDDEIRSLTISQRLLGTREIILVHHTDCGMLTLPDEEFKGQIQEK